MKKAILLSASFLILVAGMSSCKKCYDCTHPEKSQTAGGADTTIIIHAELCNKDKGGQGAGTNLKTAVSDIEANGYICKPQ